MARSATRGNGTKQAKGSNAPRRLRDILHAQRRLDRVYSAIFDAILEQRLLPGVRLSEEELGKVFGVSRTLIRQSLIRLNAEGIVTTERHRGAQVRTPTVEEATQVFAARELVELEVMRLATLNATGQDLAELEAAIHEDADAASRGDRGTRIRLSGEFHLLLALVAGNRPLFGFLRVLVSQCALVISQYERPGMLSCSADEHAELLAAMRQRDARAAREAMAQHLQHIEERCSFQMESETSDLRELFKRYLDPEVSSSHRRG